MKVVDYSIAEKLLEDIALQPYDRRWIRSFNRERELLRSFVPRALMGRIEHFGGTAVPGLVSRPVIDILVAVPGLESTRHALAPLFLRHGYDYFWRPPETQGHPFYAWFVRTDANGHATHQVHMCEPQFPQWDWLLFRDYLIEHPRLAAEYGALKLALADAHPRDPAAYAAGKRPFIHRTTERARHFYSGN